MNENVKTTVEVLILLKDHWSDFERQYIIDRYRIEPTKYEVPSQNLHKALVGRAVNLTKTVMANGGMKQEIDRALEYLMVAIDAVKYRLNVAMAYDDLGIEELLKKYNIGGALGTRKEKSRQEQLELAAKKRGVLKLHAEGKTNEEIVKEMNIPESRVRFWIKRSKPTEAE